MFQLCELTERSVLSTCVPNVHKSSCQGLTVIFPAHLAIGVQRFWDVLVANKNVSDTEFVGGDFFKRGHGSCVLMHGDYSFLILNDVLEFHEGSCLSLRAGRLCSRSHKHF